MIDSAWRHSTQVLSTTVHSLRFRFFIAKISHHCHRYTLSLLLIPRLSPPPPRFPTDLRSRILGPVLKIHTDDERFYVKFEWAKDKIKKKKRNDIWTRVKINSRRQDRFKPYLGALHTNIERSHRYVRVDCCYFRPPIISFYVYVP